MRARRIGVCTAAIPHANPRQPRVLGQRWRRATFACVYTTLASIVILRQPGAITAAAAQAALGMSASSAAAERAQSGDPSLDERPHDPAQPSAPELTPAPDTTGGAPPPGGAATSPKNEQPYLFSLHGGVGATSGKSLAELGVYVTGWNIAEYSGVTAGGLRHGSFFTNWALLGANLDMQTIAGIKGAQVHLIANDVAGQGGTQAYNGADWSFLTNWGNYDGAQLREFTWDQSLLGGRLFLLAGRSNPKGGEFEGSDIYCQFATFLCSTPTTFNINSAAPSFVTSTWGARILIKPSAATYVKGGVWEDEPWIRATNHNGWPGPDWGFDKSEGAFVPVEAGYHTDLSTDRYPRQFDVGFTYDTSVYNDPISNALSLDRLVHGGAARQRRGRTTVYVQGQQMIWKPDQRGTRGLTVFGAANVLTSGDGMARDGFVAGVFDNGPFASRPRDTAGLAFQTFLWNRGIVRAMNETLAKQGFANQWAGAETLMEANYGFAIAPGVTVTPYFEYLWNPDQLAEPVRPGVDHAVQAGVMVDVELNPALGMPVLRRVRN